MTDRLYNFLPAIYRLRDAQEGGGALRALLGVIETEFDALENDIGGLYDDWFIETCAEWLVPYIGDLLGVRGMHPGSPESFSLRAYVANTLAYRRRKGTATMLEQLARDVTGWDARVVEFFELLGTTQNLNHLRLYNVRTPDFRKADALELLESPFSSATRTADVRHIAPTPTPALPHRKSADGGGGRPSPNIPNIGIFLWRLQAYVMDRSEARQVQPGQYTFNPLGYDQPLFNIPLTEAVEGEALAISHLSEEINVPAPLRRRPLYAETEALRQSLASGTQPVYRYFAVEEPVFGVYLNGANDPLPPEKVLICDLSDWRTPPASKDYLEPDGTPLSLPIEVAVDPALGRLTFPLGASPPSVRVRYAYGFSGDVGGGPYSRFDSLSRILKGAISWQVGVKKGGATAVGPVFDTLTEAVQAWNALPAASSRVGVIAVMDSSTYAEDLTGAAAIKIPAGSQLLIAAADWPLETDPDSMVDVRIVGELAPDDARPHVLGNVSARGTASASDPNPGELALSGLLVEGKLTVLTGSLGSLRVSHCTLSPAQGGLAVKPSGVAGQQNDQLTVSLERTICGKLDLADTVPHLSLSQSVVDADGGPAAIEAPGSDADIQGSTILGVSHVRSLEAGNTIFAERVIAQRRQTGCVRFSFVPEKSQTPRRYRCQPDLALAARAEELGLDSPSKLPAKERKLIFSRMTPAFTSDDYGDPGYAQLAESCAGGILAGAEDGSEMGVFMFLQQPQRAANLRASLDEYLRFGLEAGIFYET